MSHIVEIKTEVRDAVAAASACKRLNLPEPQQDRFQLFSGQVEGLGIRLPDWKYPVVADIRTGRLQYDNYGGRWGRQEYLDRFLQGYAVEKCRLEARRKGYAVTEQWLADGSIKLTVNVGEDS